MDVALVRRFETEFAPRIVETISGLFDAQVRAKIIASEGVGRPTRLRLFGEMNEPLRRFPHPLNVDLTWDDDEIENLLTNPEGRLRFQRYLNAIPRKLRNWQDARSIDFATRTQNEPSILIGGLDFGA
ncbi:DUF5594 family protein [Trinickia mobilis]|uniref:DUF5594 family protein n=1 Tax=Trinickia mobilis TaxID=2816356 RepID=UPI001A8D4FC9|nr:DUF5594 family protein [Trinickia mobilis]